MLAAHKDLLTLEPFKVKDFDGEVWRDVAGYEGLYQVSNLGRLKSFKGKHPRLLKQMTTRSGYSYVNLATRGRYKTFTVHRLVAKAFIPNPEGKPQVNHINGIKTDNRVENLEWATPKENLRHALQTGLIPVAERKHNAQLTAEQVKFIRENPNKLSGVELANALGVSPLVVKDAAVGRTYKTVGVTPRKPQKRKFLSSEEHRRIRQIFIRGDKQFGARALGQKYGVSDSTILNIVKETSD